MKLRQLSHTTASLLRVSCLIGSVLLLAGCSTGKMVVRGSQTIMDSGIEAMNSETDLQLARAAMPANLKLMEGMLLEDPDNIDLLLFASQGFYGYGQLAAVLRGRYCDPRIRGINKSDGLTWKVKEILQRVEEQLTALKQHN